MRVKEDLVKHIQKRSSTYLRDIPPQSLRFRDNSPLFVSSISILIFRYMVPVLTHKSRIGPLEVMDRGPYLGKKIEEVIKKNPLYIMSCIKEWLDISPLQAQIFRQVTEGDIPNKFIVKDQLDILSIPNYDFCPEIAPGWWEEFKEKGKYLTPSGYVRLYQEYSNKDLQKTIKGFYV